MEEEIRRIAQENVKNRKYGMILLAIMVILSLVFFAFAAETSFQNYYAITGLILTIVCGFFAIHHFDKKIIGKKTTVDHEVERLKSLYPEEKLELPKIDDSELKLKEMIQRSNRNDMV